MLGNADKRIDVDNLDYTPDNFERLKREYDRLRMNNAQQLIVMKMRTTQGFVELHWFQMPHHRTAIEAFNMLNDMYFDYYGENRFSTYNTFVKCRDNYLKKRKS